MALDRGSLAKIDRRVFAELGHHVATQTVKVPLSDAMWSTWRRYCQAIGLTMGEGIAGLVDQELGALVSEDEPPGSVFAPELQRRLVARAEALEIRERRLDEREQSLRASERLLRARTRPLEIPSKSSVGRNDPCPCGSGYKYKRCHGI
ncbi:MAG: SEC-C metal-binding domain-containing protein [Acidimicrobiia bacterium]|nr:SEC-C metal-binding domain-containing protein [Acidimicrobiia bacterium]